MTGPKRKCKDCSNPQCPYPGNEGYARGLKAWGGNPNNKDCWVPFFDKFIYKFSVDGYDYYMNPEMQYVKISQAIRDRSNEALLANAVDAEGDLRILEHLTRGYVDVRERA